MRRVQEAFDGPDTTDEKRKFFYTKKRGELADADHKRREDWVKGTWDAAYAEKEPNLPIDGHFEKMRDDDSYSLAWILRCGGEKPRSDMAKEIVLAREKQRGEAVATNTKYAPEAYIFFRVLLPLFYKEFPFASPKLDGNAQAEKRGQFSIPPETPTEVTLNCVQVIALWYLGLVTWVRYMLTRRQVREIENQEKEVARAPRPKRPRRRSTGRGDAAANEAANEEAQEAGDEDDDDDAANKVQGVAFAPDEFQAAVQAAIDAGNAAISGNALLDGFLYDKWATNPGVDAHSGGYVKLQKVTGESATTCTSSSKVGFVSEADMAAA